MCRSWLPWRPFQLLVIYNLGEMGGLVAEDATNDLHEDVQKHAKRVSRPHKTRSKARAAPVDHPESTVEEPHSAGLALAP